MPVSCVLHACVPKARYSRVTVARGQQSQEHMRLRVSVLVCAFMRMCLYVRACVCVSHRWVVSFPGASRYVVLVVGSVSVSP